jgi:hypothetical protein
VDEEITRNYGKKTYPAILSSKKYKEKIYAEVKNKETETRLKKSEPEKAGNQQIVKVVAEVMKVDESVIYYGKRGQREVARWMAMRLYSMCSITGYFGMSMKYSLSTFNYG